jgi:hypothetical protein
MRRGAVMGKRGEELRRLKGERVKYTFTRAELEAHDQQVRRDFVAECCEALKREEKHDTST